MSILIKGIDMPNKIDLDFHDNHIVLGGVLYPIDIDQLVYIPTPHGRLIDADKLRATLRRWTEDEWNQKASPVSWAYAYEDLIDLIDDAPTILEEEK